MAAAAMTPLSFETAFMPASLPGVNFTCFSSFPGGSPSRARPYPAGSPRGLALTKRYIFVAPDGHGAQLFYRKLKVLDGGRGRRAFDDLVDRE